MDPKSRLQEAAQSRDNLTPMYKVLQEDGPDHDKLFVIGVYVDDKLLAEGSGPSKQAAQVNAAMAALKHYN